MRFSKPHFLYEKFMDKQPTQKYSATNYLLYLLSKRDYSEQELHRKLKLKEYSAEEIKQAIETAKAHNWLSDERFCQTFIRYRAQQGVGPRRLKQELKMKGVADWLISQCLEVAEAEEGLDWFELAEQTFEKKRPRVWDLKAKQKMWRFMVSRGFYQDHFSHLLNQDYDEDE